MNVLLWLTHHIMLFLLGLQSSMTMRSCSQSCVWQYFYQKRRPAENEKGADVVTKTRLAEFHGSTTVCGWGSSSSQQGRGEVSGREIMARQQRKGVWRGQLSWGGWSGHSEKVWACWTMFARTSAPFIVFTSHFSRFISTPSSSHCLSSQSLSGVGEMRTKADSSARVCARVHAWARAQTTQLGVYMYSYYGGENNVQ